MFLKVHICGSVIAYFDDITNLGILLSFFPFLKSHNLCKLSKILLGNICNGLLQVDAAIARAGSKLFYNGYQQTTKVATSKERIKGTSTLSQYTDGWQKYSPLCAVAV